MAYSLGLTLYNLANRRRAVSDDARPPRPAGRLVWLHAPTRNSLPQIAGLARRLEEDHGLNILLTSDVAPDLLHPGITWQPTPADTPAEARRMLDHWQPDVVVLSDGQLRPALLHEAHERRIPSVLVDARTPTIMEGNEGWWPGLMRGTLMSLDAVLTVDGPAARAFRRAGAPTKIVQVTGRMESPSAVLSCAEAERAFIAAQLATRPVWFAASLPEDEEAAVIAAHRGAMKLAHRLLLILSPQDPVRIPALVAHLEQDEQWVVACRCRDDELEADVQVYITEPGVEYGLWYRLAPVTYLGGGMGDGGINRDPMEAAALGSAILHGPRAGRFGTTLGRLASAQATSLVRNAAELRRGLIELLSPDRSARLAQAAWAVESDGAEATDTAIKVICDLVEGRR
ncbi:3-deoxy-D-manno-octulosonic acid transferase [Pseudorhodobacter turbinis]|uniref:3-deoxy-D-manno-octulosonic acid transferase n=1 Tax=Pseudorhodobacter turbinis TaxID=2500533 RepID=A0A4P8EFJ6_9RHOB|nr:glycosyltransferase N-terminal domain-containing protein [Pseudorhodobacter turbinis]QCO55638.1 3-deoxy-D-manno-octulosonic acid transferase [Pseudorhodobacter turbinis]